MIAEPSMRWAMLVFVFLAIGITILLITGIVAVLFKKTRLLGIVVLLGIPLGLIFSWVGMLDIREARSTAPAIEVVTNTQHAVSQLKEPPAPASVVKPAEAAIAPPNRPAWIDAQPGKVGDGYQMTATVGPYTTRLECDEALPDQLQKTTAEYVELYLGAEAQGRATLSDDFLRQHVVKETWEETRSMTVGPMIQPTIQPMIQLHARLLFDAKANEQLKQNWRDAQVRDRLWLAGRWLAAVLAVLAGIWAILKTEWAGEATRRDRPATLLAMRFGLVILVVVAVALVLLV